MQAQEQICIDKLAWIEASDVRLKFLGIIEIFEACGSCEAD